MNTLTVDKPDVDVKAPRRYQSAVRLWEARKPAKWEEAAIYFIKTDNYSDWSWGTICHASLRRIKEVKKGDVVVIGYAFTSDFAKEALTYFEWITSRISPWRCLFSEGKARALYKDGIPWGVQILECGEKRWSLARNLAIALRMAKEKPHKIGAWYKLVKEGLEPSEALFLSSFLCYNKGEMSCMFHELYADHWMITVNKIEPERFFKGEPREVSSGVNLVWGKVIPTHRVQVGYLWDLRNNLASAQTGRRPSTFGVYTFFEEGVALKVYKKWKKQNAIKGVRRRKIKIY